MHENSRSPDRNVTLRTASCRLICAVLSVSFLSLLPTAHTLIKDDEHDGPGVPICETATSAQLRVSSDEIPLLGNAVTLDARSSKIRVRVPDPEQPASCDTTLHALASVGGFAWSIVSQPPGGSTALDGTDTLAPTLTLARVGAYRIRLTACPNGCSVPTGFGDLLVPASTRDIVIDAVDEFAFPPEFEPVTPDQDATQPGQFDSFDGKCQSSDELGSVGADTIGPAWVTVERWQGAEDYELLEGVVTESTVSRRDAITNHDTQDAVFFIQPDPRDRRLLQNGQNGRLEIEWETSRFAEVARPTRGDRASVVGYWIHDCGHGGKTEIHPPVMVAAHRARPVKLPDNQNRGTNVFVPGIVSDVLIERRAGEITGNCSLSGLHQPGEGAGFDFGPHSCLPQTEGFAGGNPINRVFTFSIYLPRNPQDILEQNGREVPPVPLYMEAFNPHDSSGPQPQLTLSENGDAVNVTIDLSDFPGSTYSRRIHAAWMYAAPDNWQLSKWNLSVPLIDVHDDGDGIVRGDGDWKFWLNTNNSAQEWTRIFNCNGCVHGEETFGGTPLSTDAADADHSLGPDLLLYPGQRIFLRTTGYETDWIWSDFTGHVTTLRPQETKNYADRSDCQRSGASGCAHYTLHYRIADRGSVGDAQLSPSAQALFDAYALRPDDGTTLGELPVREVRDFNLPDDIRLTAENPTIRERDGNFFLAQSAESGSLADADVQAFRNQIAAMHDADPERLAAFFAEMQDEITVATGEIPNNELDAGLAAFRDGLPPHLWAQYFEPPVATPRFHYLWILIVLLLIASVLWWWRRA